MRRFGIEVMLRTENENPDGHDLMLFEYVSCASLSHSFLSSRLLKNVTVVVLYKHFIGRGNEGDTGGAHQAATIKEMRAATESRSESYTNEAFLPENPTYFGGGRSTPKWEFPRGSVIEK